MKLLIRCVITWLLLGVAPLALAQMAVVQSAQGDARLQSATGSTTPLVAGQSLAVGAQLETGANGQAVLRFADGHLLALKDNSSVRIAAYSFDAQRPAASSFVMELLRGGLRSITGLLGKNNPQAFRLRTATATIGIRGSDWLAALQDNSLYTGVNSGGIVVNSTENTLLVDPGQFSLTVPGAPSQLVPFAQLPVGIFGGLQQLSLVGTTLSGPAGAANASVGAMGGIAPGALAFGAAVAAVAVIGASDSTSGTTGTTAVSSPAQ